MTDKRKILTGSLEKIETESQAPASIDHDEAMIAELREDPEYAEAYLQAAFDDIYEPGGIGGFLVALRQVIESRGGVSAIAQRSGLSRQHIYRALSEKGNPTITTLTELTRAARVRLTASAHLEEV